MNGMIKVKCIDCGREIDYDGRMIACPYCHMEFESDEISEWKKELAAACSKATKKAEADTPPETATQPSRTSQPQPKSGAAQAGRFMPKAMPPVVEKVGVQDKPLHAQSGVVYEWRGVRFNEGKEKDAFLFILSNGLIDEIVDERGVTDKARHLLSAIGKRVPDMALFSRERKFFKIMYGTVFENEDVPLFVKDTRVCLPMANTRAQLLQRIENNAYDGAMFEVFGKQMTFAGLADMGVICEYLALADESRDALRSRLEQNGKRMCIDENYMCVDLGGDGDICRRDSLMFARYEYYLNNGQPCDGYNCNAMYDGDFLRAYGGYANCGVEKYMKAYFYLLSVAYNRNGVCEVFGTQYTASRLSAVLSSAVEEAAERGIKDNFLLVRQLLIHKVFGEHISVYERVVAEEHSSDAALFKAYYGLPKQKKLLYFDGKYQSAEKIARKISEGVSVSSILSDKGEIGFMTAVGSIAQVDVIRIKAEIENGIKMVLEELK